jgi:hypothetical protein
MSSSLVAMLEEKLVQVAVTAARPAIGSDGVDVTSWRINGSFSTPLAALFVDGDRAMTITSPTGGTAGVELWGYRLAQWWLIGILNKGDDIVIAGAAQGYACECDVVGIFESLAIAGTVSAGAAVGKLAPIQTWSTS